MRDSWEAFQREIAGDRRLVLLSFVSILSLLVLFALLRWELAHKQANQWSLQLATQARSAQLNTAAASPDFVQAIPVHPLHPSDLLHQLRGECTEAHVQLQQFARAPSPATTTSETQLQQQDFTVSLKGSYPAIQQVLRSLASRDPKRQVLTVQELHLRAARSGAGNPGAANEVEAQVVLRSWARPLDAAASPAEPR